MPEKRAHTSSTGIAADESLPLILKREVSFGLVAAGPDDVVIGWGRKANTKHPREFATKKGIPYWALEDGFYAYMGHPAKDPRRLSAVIDTTGIYYDASAPSDLENLLNGQKPFNQALIGRAEAAMARIRRWRLSKYNAAPYDLPAELAHRLEVYEGPKVLVVDQTYGDQSITYGLASDDSFAEMLQAALAEHPRALIVVKVHPDVLAGKKRGHYDLANPPARVIFIAEEANPQALLALMDHVYVVTSQMGFEALIAGKPVTCFGLPFYAGWGLTTDRQACERRRAKRTVAELFAAACILYARYADPFLKKPCELEDVLDLLVAEKQMPRVQAHRAIAVGFSLWKRSFITHFFGPGVQQVKFVKPSRLSAIRFQAGDALILWGRKHDDSLADVPADVPVWRMEDGFLRSVGLGTDLRGPSSLVLDHMGIYYDGSTASSLEAFLASHDFDERDLARGAALRDKILAARVSKYNVGKKGELDFRARAGGRRLILVPGQVEADASIRFSSPEVRTNAALLQAVRAAEPEAYIIFKPHPDVASGNRKDSMTDEVLAECADEVVIDADIIDCLEAVDSVHTMTSLTGFEALLRGKGVTTYGIPFYAGWGLTVDRMELPRRGRTLALEALVYGLLCVYARYISWPSRASTSAEAIVAEMAAAAGEIKVARSGPFAPVLQTLRKLRYMAEALGQGLI